MLHSPYPEIVLGGIGLLTGALIVFASPRLVRYRLAEAPPLPERVVLIPIAGAWMARYRPLRSTAVQILMAGLFAGLAAHYGWKLPLPFACFYTALLITIADIDIEYRLVLNRLSFPGIVAALVISSFWPGIGLLSALLGAIVGLLVFGAFQALGRGALGAGDTKLAVLIGAMRGFPGALSALILGVVIGGLAALFLLVALRRGRKEFFAYAPYLAAGAVISFFVVSP